MADFETKVIAQFEAYEIELGKKDTVIVSLKAIITKHKAEPENTGKRIRQAVGIAICLYPRT